MAGEPSTVAKQSKAKPDTDYSPKSGRAPKQREGRTNMERVLAMLRKLRLPGFKEPQPQEEPEHVVVAEVQAEVPSRSAEVDLQESGAPLEFDEEWYLRRYPDIAKAVAEGHVKSGLEHYLSHGRREGRLPVPPKQES